MKEISRCINKKCTKIVVQQSILSENRNNYENNMSTKTKKMPTTANDLLNSITENAQFYVIKTTLQ